ncbi:aspartate kinase [Inconstantimicrobium mannanitabidum]|uniref:Aspartokinase n=1 Tax=Inconstantimicrobium mannanitabidum TaxID=1604901 RepID=A0ACB5RCU3_9CLOT|nr:aspartate kinase [Clostridium sp. TW13]GKX67094.1 aspartokinase [Clostridium sp. TW13]
MNKIVVTKFGGSSLASAEQFKKVKNIIEADSNRKYIVPSAPGKRDSNDYKITDLLYLCNTHVKQRIPFDDVFKLISERYLGIVKELNLNFDIQSHLDIVKNTLTKGASDDYAASRGEYLNGLILANFLNADFVDAAEVIIFNESGVYDEEKTQAAMTKKLGNSSRIVIPGFYGAKDNGEIKTFSRGGSDVTGSIVAKSVKADLYENWTDVSGFLMTDPRIVENPKSIEKITYKELRELSYMGASVLHEEAIFPVRDAGIPINIRNTNKPEDKGTLIVDDLSPISYSRTITGIAGKKGFTVIAIEKALLNSEIGFCRRLLSILEMYNVSFENMPSGIDSVSLVIADSELQGKLDKVVEEIKRQCSPDSIEIHPNMALIATVGRGMTKTKGTAGRIFSALAKENINIRMIDQGSSEINILTGVESNDFEASIKAIYREFI